MKNISSNAPISVKQAPQENHVATLISQGLAFHQKGNLKEAQVIYEQVLALESNHFDALQLLGTSLAQTKQYEKAVDCLYKALKINPNHASTYFNLANPLKELGRLDEALVAYNSAISHRSDYAEALFYRGNILKELGRLDEALTSFDKAISIQPDSAQTHANHGLALHELKRLEEALASFNKAINIKSDFAQAYSNRGATLIELGRFREAIDSFDQAITIQPNHAEAYYNRGIAQQALRLLNEALASYKKATSIKPDYAEAYSNRGNVLKDLGRLNEALVAYKEAISVNPDYAPAHLNLSLLHLLEGNFKDGWQNYECRWKDRDISKSRWAKNFPHPLWLGAEKLKNKTILLYPEQGLGDTIQFSRYATLVAELGANVILGVQRPLINLLKNIEGISQIVSDGDPLPAFDYQCPLLSLPLAFKTELQTIPPAPQKIIHDSNKVKKWQLKLGDKTNPRAGLVWSGSVGHTNDHNRSLTLSKILPYLPSNLDYVCLQKEIRDIDKKLLLQHPEIKHFGDALNDFTDTAALCELMDVVISVDTSVAHLAGTLGKPTWVLLPYNPDWRWLLKRNDSPWYSSMKLYRQDKIGDWDGVLRRVELDLLAIGNLLVD